MRRLLLLTILTLVPLGAQDVPPPCTPTASMNCSPNAGANATPSIANTVHAPNGNDAIQNTKSDLAYYVAASGSDTNNGLSWGTAFATLNHAVAVATGTPATIHIGPTYNSCGGSGHALCTNSTIEVGGLCIVGSGPGITQIYGLEKSSGPVFEIAAGSAPCIKDLSLGLVSSGSIGIKINADPSHFAADGNVENVLINAAGPITPGQIGIWLNSPAPSYISQNRFINVTFVGVNLPITGRDEGDNWTNVQIKNFSASGPAIQSWGNDDQWTGRVSGTGTAATGIYLGGVYNSVNMTCDFGGTGNSCVNDVGGNNNIDLQLLTPAGTISRTSTYTLTNHVLGTWPGQIGAPLLLSGLSSLVSNATAARSVTLPDAASVTVQPTRAVAGKVVGYIDSAGVQQMVSPVVNLGNNPFVVLNMANSSVPASSSYDVAFGGFTSNGDYGTFVVPQAGKLGGLFVRTLNTQNAGGSLVCAVRVNGGSATALAVTVPAGQTSTTVSDTTDAVAVNAGDRVEIVCTNNYRGGHSASVGAVTLGLQ
jgi:hypothetical protein